MNTRTLGSFTYKKSKRALDEVANAEFKGLCSIIRVTAYLMQKKTEITSLSLQKLLYYTQSMSAVFLLEPLFLNQSEAWVHGPVYREIYDLYNENTDYIMQYPDVEPFTDTETALIDSVVACFGCYDGDILRAFTHLEDPWLEARNGLSADARSNRKISIESISKFFSKVKDEYRMADHSDMRNYARDIFDRVCG